MRTFISLVAALAAFAAAPARADEASNGLELNGIQFNGIQFNGISLNGQFQNGMKVNGASRTATAAATLNVTAVTLADGAVVTLER